MADSVPSSGDANAATADAAAATPTPASTSAADTATAAAPALPAAFFAVPSAQLTNSGAYMQSLLDQIAHAKQTATVSPLGKGTFGSFVSAQPTFVPAPTFGFIPAPQQPLPLPPATNGFGAGFGTPQQQAQPFNFGAAFAPTQQPTSVSAASSPPPAAPSTAAPLMPAFSFTFPSASTGAPAAPSSLTPSPFAFNASTAPAVSAAAAAPSACSLFPAPTHSAHPFAFSSASASSHCCFFCPESLLSPDEARVHLLVRHGFSLSEWHAALRIGLQAQTRLLRCLRAEVESQRAQLNGAFPPPSSMQQILHAAVGRFQSDQEGSGAQSSASPDLLVQWLVAANAPRAFCPFCEHQLIASSDPARHIRSYHGIDLPALAQRFRLDAQATTHVIAHIRSAVMTRAFTAPYSVERDAQVREEVEATLQAQAEGRGRNAQTQPWRQHAHKEMTLAEWLLTPPPQPAMTLADFPSSTPSLLVHANPDAAASTADSAAAAASVTAATAALAPAESNAASALSGFFAPQDTAAATFSVSANDPDSVATPSSAVAAAAVSAAPVPAVDAVCLFCQTRLSSSAVAKGHLLSFHAFEWARFARRFRMSFDAQMQCINWIRRHMDRDDPLAVVQIFAANYPDCLSAVDGERIAGRTIDDDLLLVWLPEDGHDGDPAEEDNGADDCAAAEEEEEQAQVAGIPAIQTASSFAPLSAFLTAPTAASGAAGAATATEAAAAPNQFAFGFAAQPLPKPADASAASVLSGFAQQPPQPALLVAAANIVPFSFSPPAKKSKANPPAAVDAAAAVAAAATPFSVAAAAAFAVPSAAMSNGDAPYSMFGRERKPLPPVAEKLHTHASAPLSFLGPPSASTFAFPKVAANAPAPSTPAATAAAPAPDFSFLSSLSAAPSVAAAPIVDADALFPSSDRPWMDQHSSKGRPTKFFVKKPTAVEASSAGQESKDEMEAKPAAAAMAGLAFSFELNPAKAAAAAASSIAPFSFQPPLPTEAIKDAPRTLAEIAPVDSSPEELASNDALSHVFRFLDLSTMHTVMSVAHRWRSIVSHMRSMQFPCPGPNLLFRLLPSQRHRLPATSFFFSTLDLFHPIDPKTLPLSALAKRHIGSVNFDGNGVTAEMLSDFAVALPQLRRLCCGVGGSEVRLQWPRSLEYLDLSIHLTDEATPRLPLMLDSLSKLSHLHEVVLRVVTSAWSFEERCRLNVVPVAALLALPPSVRSLTMDGELTADHVCVLRRRLPNLQSLTVELRSHHFIPTEAMQQATAALATRISAQLKALTSEDATGDKSDRPPQLQELNVVHGWTAELAMAMARVKTMTTLACIEVGPELHLDLLASLRALRTLSVSFKPTAEDSDALVVALSHAPQLTSLTLNGHNRLRPARLSAILSTHPQLQSLTLGALPSVDSLSFFAEVPPAALSTVELRDLSAASGDDLSPLLSLPALRSLCLFCRRQISPHRADVSDLRAKLGDAFVITSAFF